ncbi:alpha/beta fold hydrolase [Hamadaea tsunoensis]|uniref:alpha/beta fold hydrolase n=1 Tax=Hamadaea tsunoensis TaxID=53368 RepID=UPI00040F240A|nr:alpha/beta hydrolase [Hamadaea tsunoensis]
MDLGADVRGDGPTIVCLPWYSLDAAVSAAALEPVLAMSGLRRIYVDPPGHGRTPAGPSDADGVLKVIEAYADRVAGPNPYLLAGFSYGGYLAAALTRRRPDRIGGLLLVCPGTRVRPGDRELPVPPAEAEPGWLDGVPPELRKHLHSALGNRTARTANRIAGLLAAAAPGDPQYLASLRANGYRLSDEDSRFGYAGPTAVITGRQDGIAGYVDQFRALAAYANATYTVLDKAGHYLPFEQPDAFGVLVREWLSRSVK